MAAFAPWAVLGPALGIASSIPDMDVTSPGTLTARAFADAVRVVDGTLVWASPAAFDGILATAAALTDADMDALGSLRLVLGAGAPVSRALQHGMARLCVRAEIRTPYGMTEVLPVTDVTVAEIDAAGEGDGVLVGRPLPGVDVRVSAVDADGRATGPLTDEPGVLGEMVVRAAHKKDRYDRLWATERASSRDAGWHRTGDVGPARRRGAAVDRRAARARHHDASRSPRTRPHRAGRAAAAAGARRRRASGSDPEAPQAVVVVAVTEDGRDGVADLALTAAVRAAAEVDVAAVLLRRDLPVDIRHRSKIDRAALAAWAGSRLAGRGTPGAGA